MFSQQEQNATVQHIPTEKIERKHQLKMFKLGNKTKFMKSFSDIKATEIKLNGRLSDQIIILKAF